MKESYFNIIEDFLTGNMTQDQKQKFLYDLQTDSELYEAFLLQKAEHEAMEFLISKKLRNDIINWEKTPPPNPFIDESSIKNNVESDKTLVKNLWITGIFILITLVASYYFFTRKSSVKGIQNSEQEKAFPEIPVVKKNEENKTTPEEIIKEKLQDEDKWESQLYAYADIADDLYEKPDYLTSTLKSSSENQSNTPFQKALNDYNKNNFTHALKELNTIKNSTQSNEIFLRANVLFELKKYKEAATEFEKLIHDELLPFYEDAQWYLLLCYTATLPKSKSQYEKILSQLLTQSDGYYFNKAKQLEEKLK